MKLHSNIIVILGQALLEGNKPRSSLISRINVAIKLAIDNLPNRTTIILSGGFAGGASISEAAVMKQYIVDTFTYFDYDLLLEQKSRDTIENAIHTYDLINELTAKSTLSRSITVVTNDFHTTRTKCIFKHVNRWHSKDDTNNLKFASAESGLEKFASRPMNDRPSDVNFWYFVERLELERSIVSNYVKTNPFERYSLPPPNMELIQEALNEFDALEQQNG